MYIENLVTLAFGALLAGPLVVKIYAPLNDLLLYGKTTGNKKSNHQHSENVLAETVEQLESITVPKSWFSHYYLFYLASTLFLKWTLVNNKAVVDFVYLLMNPLRVILPNKFKNYLLINHLILFQAIRRTGESFFITRFGKSSRINFLHYLVGIGFYALVTFNNFLSLVPYYHAQLNTNIDIRNHLHYKDYVLVGIFVGVSMWQFVSHQHLATLRKYSLPNFKYISSPHYTSEIAIYLLMFLISVKNVAKPEVKRDNITINYFIAFAFVFANLSISALETHKYYKERYGHQYSLQWAVLPGVL